MPRVHRRDFLSRALSLPALVSSPSSPGRASATARESSLKAALRYGQTIPEGFPGDSSSSANAPALADRFSNLSRRFVFDYYPWYGRDPWRHWNEGGRRPPDDLATEYVPLLGAYDSRSRAVIEQHARWIAASGAASICLSWWGNGNYEDRAVDDVMDVMKDHGIAVTFGLEPYSDDRGFRFANDVLYLLKKYGERRGWDAFLILGNEDGSGSPVFKGFRCILPETFVDCHGRTREIYDHTPDALWRRQIDFLRRELRWDFERVYLLADSLDFGRTRASGFDGIAIYDNFIPPERYLPLARGASREDLLFSFNVNPGYDEIPQGYLAPDSCYEPRPFVPPTHPLDFDRFDHRELAAALSAGRIRASLAATVEAQSDPTLENWRRGFFVVYINSFNEWHEGHAFEPMKRDVDLGPEQRPSGYHNPAFGDYRLATLTDALRPLLKER